MRPHKKGEAGLQAVLKETQISKYDNVQNAEEEVIAFLIYLSILRNQ